MTLSAMEQYWVWLSSIDGIGPVRFYSLLAQYEDARAVWDDAKAGHLQGLGEQTRRNVIRACSEGYFYDLFEKLARLQITPVTRISENYSELLSDIHDAPPTLYVRGDPDLNVSETIGIVGTRRPTRDGRRAATEFAEQLARCGAVVISGLARGIDTCAHTGALQGGGRTIAVLGCGCDVVYPPENGPVYEQILESGGSIVSEYLPGTQPLAQNFPGRNRIISGLSRGVLLVEGALRSGGLITVNYANEQGRDVFAVPGSIYAEMSKGPDSIIMQGALPVISPWDIPEHYRWGSRPEVHTAQRDVRVQLMQEEETVVAPMRSQEMTLGELCEETGFSAAKLNSLLTMLELRGIICKVPGGGYRAV